MAEYKSSFLTENEFGCFSSINLTDEGYSPSNKRQLNKTLLI
jgi:hypothetical protein